MADRRLIPWLGFSVACLGVLMLQADLGTALLYYGVALMLYFASSGNPVLMLCGIGGGVGAALLGYQKFAHVKSASRFGSTRGATTTTRAISSFKA